MASRGRHPPLDYRSWIFPRDPDFEAKASILQRKVLTPNDFVADALATEAELIAAARHGDNVAFERLVGPTGGGCTRTVAHIAGIPLEELLAHWWHAAAGSPWQLKPASGTLTGAKPVPARHAAMVTWAIVVVMTRRLARPHRPPSIQTKVA